MFPSLAFAHVRSGSLRWVPKAVPIPSVRFYGMVDETGEQTIELFARKEDAERFLADVRGDDPELADTLRLELVELDA
jgi:hypothetical protein